MQHTNTKPIANPLLGFSNSDIDDLVANRHKFTEFVYTPFEEAVAELERRQEDKRLETYISSNLPAGVPSEILNKKCAFLSRSLGTPNYEARRFLSIIDAAEEFTAVFWEYCNDKFTPNVNATKYNLGKMTFYLGLDKKGGQKIAKSSVLDFNTENSKKISDVKTLWGQSLSDFHHELFEKTDPQLKLKKVIFYDATDWYIKSGGDVKKYYKHIFMLFLKNGILFENFLINNESEAAFTREVFLPAFIEIIKETGKKPLMVALEPTHIEGDDFWMYYPQESQQFVKEKLNLL